MKSSLYIWIPLCVCAILGHSSHLTADQKANNFSSLQNLQKRLLSSSDADRTALAAELGLVIPAWRRWGAKSSLPCALFDSVEDSIARLDEVGTQALVVIYSENCEYTYLVVFDQTTDGEWVHRDTVLLWSKLGQPKVSLESLIGDTTKEIVADNCTVDTGTGVAQTDFMILRLISGRLQVVLDAPERVEYALQKSQKGTGSTVETQESTFAFVSSPDEEPKTSSKQVVEKRVIGEGTNKTTQWWLYIWLPETRRFQAIRTTPRQSLP